MKFLHFLDDHKTKILGAFVTALGALQANPELLRQVLSPTAFAWTMLAAGVIITVIGSTNTARQKQKQAK